MYNIYTLAHFNVRQEGLVLWMANGGFGYAVQVSSVNIYYVVLCFTYIHNAWVAEEHSVYTQHMLYANVKIATNNENEKKKKTHI